MFIKKITACFFACSVVLVGTCAQEQQAAKSVYPSQHVLPVASKYTHRSKHIRPADDPSHKVLEYVKGDGNVFGVYQCRCDDVSQSRARIKLLKEFIAFDVSLGCVAVTKGSCTNLDSPNAQYDEYLKHRIKSEQTKVYTYCRRQCEHNSLSL